mgnify:CR=1 FL=1
MEKNLALELIDFLYDSPSACHGVKATQKILWIFCEFDKQPRRLKGTIYGKKRDRKLSYFLQNILEINVVYCYDYVE